MMRIELSPYDDSWPARFDKEAAQLWDVLGDVAERIEHIGSTAVPGLAAKPIIDVQVSVPSLESVRPCLEALRQLGFEFREEGEDRRKVYFRRRGSGSDVNLHVRRSGEFSEQAALLFRDYLRASEDARRRYEAVKRELATREWERVDDYADAKGDCVWQLLREADRWSWQGGDTR